MSQETDIAIFPCAVYSLDRVSPKVIVLSIMPLKKLRVQAGQYITILAEDGKWRSFSVANAPDEGNVLQLHIAHVQYSMFSDYVFNTLSIGDVIYVRGPLGIPFCRKKSKPIIFLAGGTGFAPVKSIVEYMRKTRSMELTTLYWGAQSLGDLYMLHLPREWQKDQPSFRFVPVLSKPKETDAWQGRTGYVHQAVIEDFSDLSGYAVYAYGPPGMMDAAFEAFTRLGLQEDAFFAQGFSPCPKPMALTSNSRRTDIERSRCLE